MNLTYIRNEYGACPYKGVYRYGLSELGDRHGPAWMLDVVRNWRETCQRYSLGVKLDP